MTVEERMTLERMTMKDRLTVVSGDFS